MRSLSVEVKLALGLTVVAVLVAGAGAWITGRWMDRNVRAAASVSLRRNAEAFDAEERAQLEKLAATLEALGENPELRAAFVARDRARLLAAARPILERLRERHGVTHWYFHLPGPGGAVFLRVHRPELHGDRVERETLRQAQEARGLGAGKELGKTAFALRAVLPWMDGDETIGYLELGQEFDLLLRELRRRTGDDFALLVKKRFLDERAWTSVLGPRQLTWNDRPDVVVIDASPFTDGLVDFDGDVEDLPDEGRVLGHVERGDRALLRGVVPLRDARGRKVGGLLVLHDFTAQHSALEAGGLRLYAAFLGVSLAGAAAVLLLVHALVFRRLALLRRGLEERAGGSGAGPARPVRLATVDDLGRLEALFERLTAPRERQDPPAPR